MPSLGKIVSCLKTGARHLGLSASAPESTPALEPGKARAEHLKSRGEWGERLAEEMLLGKGWKVLARNVRPCRQDKRCEIDRIFLSDDGGVVFVEVKTHARRTEYDSRLKSINARKKQVLLRACTAWLRREGWKGNFRFDVVEVWGTEVPGEMLVIDHIENVPLFTRNWRFW